MEQSPINNVQPEQQLSSDLQPIDNSSSPNIAKPIVGCSASLSTEKLKKLEYLGVSPSEIIVKDDKEFYQNRFHKLVELTDERIDIEVKRKLANDTIFKSDIYHIFI